MSENWMKLSCHICPEKSSSCYHNPGIKPEEGLWVNTCMEECFNDNDDENGDTVNDDPHGEENGDENDDDITTVEMCYNFCDALCQEQGLNDCSHCKLRCYIQSFDGLYLMLLSNGELIDRICPATEAVTSTIEPTTTSTDFQTTVEATTEFATTVAPSICEDRRLFECPINSECVSADTNHGYACECNTGFKMNGRSCEKIMPETQHCPEMFRIIALKSVFGVQSASF